MEFRGKEIGSEVGEGARGLWDTHRASGQRPLSKGILLCVLLTPFHIVTKRSIYAHSRYWPKVENRGIIDGASI